MPQHNVVSYCYASPDSKQKTERMFTAGIKLWMNALGGKDIKEHNLVFREVTDSQGKSAFCYKGNKDVYHPGGWNDDIDRGTLVVRWSDKHLPYSTIG